MLDKEIDLNALNVFLRAVETGSLAGAARSLGLPPNTCSRRVQQLENDLGVRLIQRNTRKFSLSGAGLDFYERTRMGMSQIGDALRMLPRSDAPPCGRIKVAAPAALLEFVSFDLLAAFLDAYPRLGLMIRLDIMAEDLIDAGFDVAFVPSVRMSDSSLVARRIASSRLCVVGSPAYLARRGVPCCIADLSKHECLTHADAKWAFGSADEVLRLRVAGRFSIDSACALRAAACAGMGLVQAPRALVRSELASGALLEVLADQPAASITIYAVYADRRNVPSAVTALIDFVAIHLPSDGAADARGDAPAA